MYEIAPKYWARASAPRCPACGAVLDNLEANQPIQKPNEEDYLEEEVKLKPALIHRDDIPFRLAEHIVDHMQRMFPGHNIRFAGDVPIEQLPPGIESQLRMLTEAHKRSIEERKCFHCGYQFAKNEEPVIYTSIADVSDKYYLCSDCEKEENSNV